MKKGILYITILLCISILTCACSKKDDKKVDEIAEEDVELDYEVDQAMAFCLDEVGNLYTLLENQKTIQAFDADGKLIKEYSVGEYCAPYLSLYDNSLYYISTDSLYELDLTSGESRSLYKLEGDFFSFNSMIAYQDSVYFIQKGLNDDEQASVRYDETDWYTYEGEKLLCYDKVKKEIKSIDIPNIKLITKKNDTELLVYAYDGEGGFYFTTYNVTTGEMADKAYTDMRINQIYSITYDNALNKVICEDYKGLFAVDITKPASQSYFYEEGFGLMYGNSVQYQNGYTYYILNIDGVRKVIALYNIAYIKENPTLKVYTIGTSYMPDGFGYQLDCQELSESELATVLLAGDSDYDIAVLSSGNQISRNIRDLGAYETLDSVEGMDDFINQCFDYIGEAAKDKDGNLWMLPIGIDCPLLIYNTDLFTKYGIELKDIDTYDKFIDTVLSLPKDETEIYDIPYYYMTEDIVNKYVSSYAIKGNKSNFDTELFRKYTEIMSKYNAGVMDGSMFGSQVNYYYDPNIAGELSEEEYKDLYYSKVILSMNREGYYVNQYYPYDYYKAAAMPGLEEGEKAKSIAECYFIILNPNSKNLKWAKKYLGEVCTALKEDTNSFMRKDLEFKDNQLRAEVQEVYADAQVTFQYPYEIVTDELNAYLMKGKSLDDAIQEMERKMDMYLNE